MNKWPSVQSILVVNPTPRFSFQQNFNWLCMCVTMWLCVCVPHIPLQLNTVWRQNQSISRFIFMGKAVNIAFCFYSLGQSESRKSRRHIIMNFIRAVISMKWHPLWPIYSAFCFIRHLHHFFTKKGFTVSDIYGSFIVYRIVFNCIIGKAKCTI